jgi:hypothetical protein
MEMTTVAADEKATEPEVSSGKEEVLTSTI